MTRLGRRVAENGSDQNSTMSDGNELKSLGLLGLLSSLTSLSPSPVQLTDHT